MTRGDLERALLGLAQRLAVANPEGWAQHRAGAWAGDLAAVDAEAVRAACEAWPRAHDRPPTLAQLLEACRAARGHVAGAAQGCIHCEHTGRRVVIVAWTARTAGQPHELAEYLAACDCAAGQGFSRSHPGYEELARHLAALPAAVRVVVQREALAGPQLRRAAREGPDAVRPLGQADPAAPSPAAQVRRLARRADPAVQAPNPGARRWWDDAGRETT